MTKRRANLTLPERGGDQLVKIVETVKMDEDLQTTALDLWKLYLETGEMVDKEVAVSLVYLASRRVINIDEDTFFLVSIISKLKFRLVISNNRVSGVKLFCYKSYSPIWSIEVKGIAESSKIILSKLKQDMKDEYVDNLMVKLSSHLISVLSIVS